MSQTLDPQIRTRALLYTGGMAVLLTLLILLLKWRIELPLKPEEPTSIEVELNLPPDPPTESFDEGGGGGEIPFRRLDQSVPPNPTCRM